MNAGISIRVYGTPVPQGSMKGFLVKGRVNLTSANTNLKPWRETVKQAALQRCTETFDEALTVSIYFLLRKPLSTPKRVLWPIKKPDLDKLVRGIFDALTDAGVWTDDSIVIELFTSKHFVDEGEKPGAHIHIKPVIA